MNSPSVSLFTRKMEIASPHPIGSRLRISRLSGIRAVVLAIAVCFANTGLIPVAVVRDSVLQLRACQGESSLMVKSLDLGVTAWV